MRVGVNSGGEEEDLEFCVTSSDKEDLKLGGNSGGGRAWALEVIRKSFTSDWGRDILNAGE